MKKITILIILFFTFSSLFSQTGFYGNITDSKGENLAYTNVYLKKNRIGTSSNISGYYELQINHIKYKQDTLIISFVGYKTDRIPVIVGGMQKQNIVLKETIQNIETVSILAEKPKYTALQIIQKARREVKNNYVTKTVIQEGFYREKFEENGITLKINECAFDFKSTGYPNSKFSNKSFREKNDDYWDNNLSGMQFSSFSQNWPLYITPNDKVNIIESRMSNECSSLDGKHKKIGDPFGGAIDIISLNNINYKLDFFNPKLTKKYQYKITGVKYIDSKICYVINYARKDTSSFIYWHRYDKKVRYTLFKGEIVVRKSDFSVMSFWSESINWQNCVNPGSIRKAWHRTYYPNRIKFNVEFQEIENGLILKSVKYESNFNSDLENASNYKWYRELALSKPKEKQFKENTIDYFPVRRRTLRTRITSYDSTFWKGFEKSELYIPLSKMEKEDLEVTMQLQAQFELINQDVSEIPLPNYVNIYSHIFKSRGRNKIDSAHFDNYLKEENDYANTVLQKLNDYERAFQPNRILHHNYDVKPSNSKKKQKYFRKMDSLRIYYIYETKNDSCTKPIFNITYETSNNKGGGIEILNFSKNYVFIGVKNVKQLEHTLKIKQKANINTLDSITYINEFAIVNDSLVVYTTFKDNRPSSLYLHRIGTPQEQDSLLYFEQDEEYDIELSETTSEDFIIVDVTSKNQNEIWVVNKSNSDFKLVNKRKDRQQIKLDHFSENKFFTTLLSSNNYRIIKIDINSLQSEILLKSRKIINDFYLFRNKLIYSEYEKFDMSLVLFDLNEKKSEYINPQNGFNYITFLKNRNITDSISFYIESAINPYQKYIVSLKTGEYKLIDEDKYSYSSQKSKYQSEIIYVKSDKNIKIPVLLYYDKKAIKDSVTALLIRAYGAYGGINISTFDELNITLLKKGFVLAEPAVRGGSINGQDWYYEGKLLNKKNTFNDFIVVTRQLKKKFNLPSKRTFAKGTSAGGLIMGVMANEYSKDFGGIILDRPYLDVYNSIKDSSKYLTTVEYQEWGNPESSEVDSYIKSYSPLQNIKKNEYTNLFFRASKFDFVTPTSDILKSVIKYRQNNNSNNLILLKTRKNEGHMVRYNYKEIAEEYAFMMYIINKWKNSK